MHRAVRLAGTALLFSQHAIATYICVSYTPNAPNLTDLKRQQVKILLLLGLGDRFVLAGEYYAILKK